MEKTLSILIQADNLLDSISVKGNDVFQLARSRNMLKEVYDELIKKQSEVSKENGG